MELDQLLDLLSVVAQKSLPILGFIVLVFLILFVKHLIVLLKSANEAIISMKTTLDTANKELETLEKPLNTLNELSDTIDTVHEASKTAVRSALVAVIENLGAIKDWALQKSKKGETTVEREDMEEE
ncbi:histidine kinase [[Eubacterium] hominis]|uniref:histidine kinase n=1 Tax=[Eubacterium] hominis TaxID=2764325 RepID=UPI003A4DEB80